MPKSMLKLESCTYLLEISGIFSIQHCMALTSEQLGSALGAAGFHQRRIRRGLQPAGDRRGEHQMLACIR